MAKKAKPSSLIQGTPRTSLMVDTPAILPAELRGY